MKNLFKLTPILVTAIIVFGAFRADKEPLNETLARRVEVAALKLSNSQVFKTMQQNKHQFVDAYVKLAKTKTAGTNIKQASAELMKQFSEKTKESVRLLLAALPELKGLSADERKASLARAYLNNNKAISNLGSDPIQDCTYACDVAFYATIDQQASAYAGDETNEWSYYQNELDGCNSFIPNWSAFDDCNAQKLTDHQNREADLLAAYIARGATAQDVHSNCSNNCYFIH